MPTKEDYRRWAMELDRLSSELEKSNPPKEEDIKEWEEKRKNIIKLTKFPSLDKIDPPYVQKLDDRTLLALYKYLHTHDWGAISEELVNADVFVGIEMLKRGIYRENKIDDVLTEKSQGMIEEYPTPKGLSETEIPIEFRKKGYITLEEVLDYFPKEFEIRIPPSGLYLSGSLVNKGKIPIAWLDPESEHDIDLIHRGEKDRRVIEVLVSKIPPWLSRKIRYHADREGPIMGYNLPLYNLGFYEVRKEKMKKLSPWEIHQIGLARGPTLFRPFVPVKPRSCKAHSGDIQEYFNLIKNDLPEHLKEEIKYRPISEIGEIREGAESMKQAETDSIKKKKKRIWTSSEDEILRNFYGRIKTKIIAEALNRHIGSVKSRAWKLGLASDSWRTPLINYELNSSELAYLAGIIDGEGTITRGASSPRLSIATTDIRLVNYLEKLLRKRAVSYLKRNRNPKHKIGYQIVIGRASDKLILLQRLLPFLILKKQQAELAIRFLESRFKRGESSKLIEEEKNLMEEIVKLNRKGRYGNA